MLYPTNPPTMGCCPDVMPKIPLHLPRTDEVELASHRIIVVGKTKRHPRIRSKSDFGLS